jgi:RsiW-degrading membrane proteinase PrsW (M82 family)
MQNIDFSFAQDPNTLALALIYGMVPAVAWVFFWMREHYDRPKRSSAVLYAFLAGALMVIAALPVEKFLGTLSQNDAILTILWASAEEVLKFCAFLLVLLMGSAIEAPVDYALYAAVVALGFAGFENALYFLQPLQAGDSVVLILASAMRFLGTTLMHAASTSLPGIALGLVFFRSRTAKFFAALSGFVLAAALHSAFNLRIVQNGGLDFFQVFGFLWISTIVILAIFERLRRMGSLEYRAKKRGAAIDMLASELARVSAKHGLQITDERPLEDASFISLLRSAYTAYLISEGALPAAAEKDVLALVPDTLTPKAASGLISNLRR